MDECFEGLTGVHCIVDDILVHGRTRQEHDKNLRAVLDRCKSKGVKLNPDKCQIGLTEVSWFGHKLTSDGLKADPEKLKAILCMKTPNSRAKLETLLGMVTYLSKFSPNLAEITSPLRALLKNDVDFQWSEQHEAAFNKVKKALTESPILAYFDKDKQVTLQVDSSKDGLGACLMQDGKPVMYASKSLTKTEIGYAMIEKELLAITFGVTRFHHYVYGRQVVVESDHKPIESIMKKPLASAPARTQRMLLKLQPYDIQVIHRPGKTIPVADTLSRNFLDDTCPGLIDGLNLRIHSVSYSMSDRRLEEVKMATENDADMCILKKVIRDGWPDKKADCQKEVLQYWNFRDELTVTDDIILKGEKIVIPLAMRKSMLDKIHIGHMGITKCTRRARDVMFWPGLTKEIADMIQQCDICLTRRNSNTKEPMKSHPIPDQPWQEIATDIFTLDGTDYLITVDYYSRYFEIDRLTDTKSVTIIRKLKTHFARYGICQKLISDNGPQFKSEQFAKFAENWGFEHSTSSPLYPQSNGLAEKTVSTAKRLLTKAKQDNRDPYLSILEYRNCPLECGYSPSQLLMSRRLRSVIPMTKEQLRQKTADENQVHDKLEKTRSKQKSYYDRTAKPLSPLKVGQNVRVQINRKWIPAKVLKDNNDRSYNVKTNKGIYRRNRRFLMSTAEKLPDVENSDNFENLILLAKPNIDSENATDDLPSDKGSKLLTGESSEENSIDHKPHYTTRYGRVVKPTQRFTVD
jgi:transposase InsO family protein